MIGKDSLFKIDYLLVIVVSLVVAIGVLMIYSAGFDPIDKVNNGMYKKQILWFIFGFIIMIGVALLNYQQIGDFSLHIYGIVLVVLALTTFFGTPIRNTRAWITLGPLSIQPSEFMKIALVIVLGKLLVLRERDIKNFRELLIPTVLTFIPMILVAKQPDFGSAMIFIPILFIMLFVGGADLSHLVSIVAIAFIGLFVPMILIYIESVSAQETNIILSFFNKTSLLYIISGVFIMIASSTYLFHVIANKPIMRKIYIPSTVLSLGLFLSVVVKKYFIGYQKNRIITFFSPENDQYGAGYNIIQSKIAIGSGGFFGKGFLKGTQTQLGFLPETTSDFIFCVVAEEWGFFGSVILLSLLASIVFLGIQTAMDAKDKFGALLASGVTSIFLFHILINIGMVIGVMPVTGLPLCFVSYGGSNLLMAMLGVGILISVRSKKAAY